MKFMTRLSLPMIITLFFVNLISAETKNTPPQESFHVAQSDAENALDGILHLYNNDNNMHRYVLGTPEYDAKKDTGYSRLFTKSFLQTFAKKQSEAVKNECDSKYDDKCRHLFSPFVCSQNFSSPGYTVQTMKNDGRKALIFYEWLGNTPKIAKTLYRLVKVRGEWKLDGIDCGDGTKFNMDQD